MKMNSFLRQGLKSSLIAVFLAWPAIGWSATVTDRPLFIDASVDHNLMFVVDDSGSMDYEIIAPKVGEMSGNITSYYLFNPGSKSKYEDGRRLYSSWYDFKRANYFLRSSVYNYQYYDPADVYEPWPSGTTSTYAAANIKDAMLDPGFGSASKKYDLTKVGDLDLGNYDAVPATLFVVNEDATVYQITKGNFESCSGIGANESSSYDNMCYKYADDGDHYYINRPIKTETFKL